MRFTNEYPYRNAMRECAASPSMSGAGGTHREADTHGYGNMTRCKLLREIDALAFAKTEIELYLDAYPDCQKALADYRSTQDMLHAATEEYERHYAPLTAGAGATGNRWSWVDMPWPWQNDKEDR